MRPMRCESVHRRFVLSVIPVRLSSPYALRSVRCGAASNHRLPLSQRSVLIRSQISAEPSNRDRTSQPITLSVLHCVVLWLSTQGFSVVRWISLSQGRGGGGGGGRIG